MTFGQKDIWIVSQFQTEAGSAFNLALKLELRGLLDLACLNTALASVVERHEALRGCISPDGSRYSVDPSARIQLQSHDLTRFGTAHVAKATTDLLSQVASHPFHPQKAPLAAFHLLKLAQDRHLLVAVTHQMACDLDSLHQVLCDLGELYSRHAQAQAPATPLPIAPRTPTALKEFLSWESTQYQSLSETSLAYWKNLYPTLPPPLDLPSFKSRPPEQSFGCVHCLQDLPSDLKSRVDATAQQLGITSETLLFSVYATLIHRLSQQDDIAIGYQLPLVPEVRDSKAALPSTLLLPVRVQIQPAEPFAQFASRLHASLRDAREHPWVSFRDLLHTLNVPRDLSRPPLIAALFRSSNWESAPRFHQLTTQADWLPSSTFSYDLGCHLAQQDNKIGLTLTGNNALFDSETLHRWTSHFNQLLLSATANPTTPVGAMTLLSQEESDRILKLWNQSDRDIGSIHTLHQLISSSAQRWPERVAVASDGLQYTYQQLEDRSNQLANLLHARGVQREMPVAVCFERTADVLVGLLGILKAGGVYVPVDPDAPADRTSYVLEHTEAAILLTHDRLASRFQDSKIQVIRIDADWPEIARESTQLKFTPHSDPHQLVYILYTSGSTGKPKGVQLEHGNVVNFLISMRDDLGVTANDVFLALTTFTFDIAVLELYLPLIVGARTVVVPRSVVLEPDQLASALERHQISLLQATPTTWRMLFASGWKGRPGLVGLCGGEALPPDLAEKLIQACAKPWNVYGPTETTVWSTAGIIRSQQTITLGDRLANTTLYVVDDRLQPVPIGVPGELLIGGKGVARGYRKNPELTESKFIADPFLKDSSSRVFKTADQVRCHPNGQIEYLGRRDFQVKLRGYRIELGEIESVLITHPLVKEAAVILREDVAGQPHLAAYVVLKNPPANLATPAVAQQSAEFKQFLSAKIPAYMVPSVFVELPKLPQTLNGKLDRKALPAVKSQELAPQVAHVPPQTPTEIRVAGIWARLLKIEKIGTQDNYFDLGGQSVLAVTLFKELEEAFGTKLPLATLFRAPTVGQLAGEIDAATSGKSNAAASWSCLVPIRPQGNHPPLFLVHGAGGNVLLYQALAKHLAPDFPLYGLQSMGLDESTAPLHTIEEMAAQYIREIRSVQPQGPYCIGGYCMGGTVAYEMAQQLGRDGHLVPLIAMLDTYNFSRALKRDSSASIAQRLRFHLSNFLQLRPRDVIGYVKEKFRVAGDGEWARMVGSKKAAGSLTETQDESAPKIAVQPINDDAAYAYKPSLLNGRLTLFKPKVNYDFYPDPQMGWGDMVTGGLEIIELPVNPHAMLVEPFVQTLAAKLKECILNGTTKTQPPSPTKGDAAHPHHPRTNTETSNASTSGMARTEA